MKRQFTIGVAWSSLGSWIEQITSVAAFIIIARIIDPEAFGIASMAFAFLLLGEFLVRDTFAESVVEAHQLKPGQLEATFVVATCAALALALVLALLAQPIAALYGQAIVGAFILVTCPTIVVIGVSSVSTALLRREQRYRAIAVRDIIAAIAGAVIGIGMALMDYGAWSLAGQRLAVVGAYGIFDLLAARWMPRRLPRREEFGMVRGLAMKVFLLRTVTIIITQSPTVILGIAAQPAAVGLYAIAMRLTEMVQLLIVKPLRAVAQPALAALRRSGGQTARFYLDINEITALASFAVFAGLALVAGPFLSILMGDAWTEAAGPLPWLCLAGALSAVAAVQEGYLMAINRTGRLVFAAAIEAAVGLIIVAIAAPHGIMAVGFAVALRAAIAFPLRTRATLLAEGVPVGDFATSLSVPLAPVILMAGATALWISLMPSSLGALGLLATAVIVGIASFSAVLFLAMPGLTGRLKSFVAREMA